MASSQPRRAKRQCVGMPGAFSPFLRPALLKCNTSGSPAGCSYLVVAQPLRPLACTNLTFRAQGTSGMKLSAVSVCWREKGMTHLHWQGGLHMCGGLC